MAFHLRIAYIVLLSTLTFEVNSPWWSSFCYDILFCVTDDLCNLIRAIKNKNKTEQNKSEYIYISDGDPDVNPRLQK